MVGGSVSEKPGYFINNNGPPPTQYGNNRVPIFIP